MMSSVDIVQITDLHLGKSPDFNLAGINPVDSFNAVLDAVDIAGRGDDLLLLSGDLSGDSSAQAYVCLNEILRRRSKRAIWLPGNHDDLELMQAGLVNYPRSPVTDVGGWGIVSIDSSQVGTPAGFISDSELNLLDARLRQLLDRAVILSMHHCPINLGSRWLDHQKIANADELYALLSNYSNIKAVVTGHVHQQYDGLWHQLPLYTTPSSCVQFKQKSDEFCISQLPPGYRWFTLEADGNVVTGVEFIDNFTQIPDTQTTGY